MRDTLKRTKSKNLLSAKPIKLRKVIARHITEHGMAWHIVCCVHCTHFHTHIAMTHVYNHLSAETKNQIQTEIRSVILPFSNVKVSKSISIRQVIYFTVSLFRSLFFFGGLSCSSSIFLLLFFFSVCAAV